MEMQDVSLGFLKLTSSVTITLFYMDQFSNLKPYHLKPVSAISQSISQSGSQLVIHLQQRCVTPTRAVAMAIVPRTFFNLVQRSSVC